MITTPDRVTCPTCEGRRVFIETVPFTRTAHGVTYPVKYGETRERLHECGMCHGRGTVDTRIHAEQAAIDADKAEWEATLPDYDAHADARIAAGLEPW